MSSANFHTSSQRMLGNNVAVFMREFDATHSLQQWVLSQDASSNISTSHSDEWYGIPKSDEFMSREILRVVLRLFDVLTYSLCYWRPSRETYAGDVGHPDYRAVLFTMDTNSLLLCPVLRLEQIIVARGPLVITLAIPHDCSQAFTHKCLCNIPATIAKQHHSQCDHSHGASVVWI